MQFAFFPPSSGIANASVGLNGSPAPTSSTEIGFINGSGNETAVSPSTPLPTTVTNFPAEQNVNLNEVGGVAFGLGQSAAASSLSIVIASDQIGILSTAALQTSGNASLSSILANQTNGTQETQIVGTVPLPTGAATEATLAAFSAKTAAGFVPEMFDEVDLTYVGSSTDIATATYKLSGSTVATLTLTYDGSDRLMTVVKT